MKYPILVRSDNLSAVNWLSSEACLPSRAINMDVQLHFIRDHVGDSFLQVEHVQIDENEADVLTKSLERGKSCTMLHQVGVGIPEEECLDRTSTVLIIYRDCILLK